MAKKQYWNSKIKAYVKGHFVTGKGFVAFDVKQKEPTKPFKGIDIAKKKK